MNSIRNCGNHIEFYAFGKLVKMDLDHEVMNKKDFYEKELTLLTWAVV